MQAHTADLVAFQPGENLLRRGEVGHSYGLDRGTEECFQGLGVFGADFQSLRDGREFLVAQHGRQPALQQRLGAFTKTLPFFLQLLEQFQPGGLLGQASVDFLQLALRFAKILGRRLQGGLGGLRLVVAAALVGARFLDARVHLGE